MTPKQRVQTALAHQQPDRVPLEMSFTPEFAQRLRTHLFGGAGERHNPHGGGNDYALELELGLDVLLTSVGWANSYYAGDLYNPGADHYTDEWGIGWKNIAYQTRFDLGFYTEFHNPPLADDSLIDAYQPPDPNRPERYTAVKIAYHTDGYVEPIIGELIEIGVDVLHPVQPACMDPAKLKKQFGDRLCFMGSVDVQNTLPFGSVDDVRREVRERIHTLGANGGLILAPTHHVQLDTPIENLLALVETAKNPDHGA